MEVIRKCIGPQRLRRIQRTLSNFEVTILCLFLIAVVLRGTVGPGKFAAHDQDFIDFRNRLLVKLQSTLSDGGTDKPYRLGPAISDWDELRRKWLKNNRGFLNFIRSGKPRVLLVTGSSPEKCENSIGDHYLLKSIKNKIDYCRLHGIEIFYNLAVLNEEMTRFWGKLPLIRKLLLSHPEVEFIWWMDSDAMFTDMSFEIPWDRYRDFNLVMHGWKEMGYDQRSWVGLNTGSFLMRNCQWSLDILDMWAPLGPRGKT